MTPRQQGLEPGATGSTRAARASDTTETSVVVMLASFVAVSRVTSNTSRRVVGQWGGTGGAICEDHLALAGSEGRGGVNYLVTL